MGGGSSGQADSKAHTLSLPRAARVPSVGPWDPWPQAALHLFLSRILRIPNNCHLLGASQSLCTGEDIKAQGSVELAGIIEPCHRCESH